MKFDATFFVRPDGIAIPRAPELSRARKLAVYRRDRGVCQRCGTKVKFGGNTASPYQRQVSGHIDHIFPRARGGQNDDENLRVLCISCNTSKGAR